MYVNLILNLNSYFDIKKKTPGSFKGFPMLCRLARWVHFFRRQKHCAQTDLKCLICFRANLIHVFSFRKSSSSFGDFLYSIFLTDIHGDRRSRIPSESSPLISISLQQGRRPVTPTSSSPWRASHTSKAPVLRPSWCARFGASWSGKRGGWVCSFFPSIGCFQFPISESDFWNETSGFALPSGGSLRCAVFVWGGAWLLATQREPWRGIKSMLLPRPIIIQFPLCVFFVPLISGHTFLMAFSGIFLNRLVLYPISNCQKKVLTGSFFMRLFFRIHRILHSIVIFFFKFFLRIWHI